MFFGTRDVGGLESEDDDEDDDDDEFDEGSET